MFVELWSSTRPRQWLKNLFVFPALVFSENLLEPSFASRTLGAFLCFWSLSAGIYLVNDLLDLEQDRQHPQKSKRPLASGALSVPVAIAASLLLIAGGGGCAFLLESRFGWVTVVYTVLNFAYSVRLKHVVLVDVLCVASGYLLRALGGAVVIDVYISTWFVLCAFSVTLFVSVIKRRQELVILGGAAERHRATLGEYTLPFLDQVISILTSGTLICYALYAMGVGEDPGQADRNMQWTIPFVLYGVLRYLFLVYRREEGAEPEEVVWRDRPLQAAISLWLAVSMGALYIG